jgi:hypothetical protein
MKHFVTACLLVIALFASVTSKTVYESEAKSVKSGIADRQTLPFQEQGSFNTEDLLIGFGLKTEQARLNNSLHQLSLRIFPSLSNVSRINHSTKLDLQKYITGSSCFLLKSAFKQVDGYYLYNLCKLLI